MPFEGDEGHPAWEDFVILAFDEIRFCGAKSVQVMRRMKAMVSDLISALPEERNKPLRHYQEGLSKTIARSFADIEEKQEASVEDRQGLGGASQARCLTAMLRPGIRSHQRVKVLPYH